MEEAPPPPPPTVCAFDLEGHLIGATQAPKIVCGSWARSDGSSGIVDADGAISVAHKIFTSGDIVAGAHIAFDEGCVVELDPTLWLVVFKALREGRVHDVLIAQALDAIYHGTLGIDPRTFMDLRNEAGKVTGRYSLWNVTGLVLGRWDAKENDAWKLSYAILDGIPIDRWPKIARQYPVDDAVNTRDVAMVQRGYCGRPPSKNIENLSAQVEFAFCIHLGAAHGLRTDGDRVELLAEDVEEKYQAAVKRFTSKGWYRADGSEDQAAVKKSVVIAYGVDPDSACPVCDGSGKVRHSKTAPCRGVKARGRYQGCAGSTCSVCSGTTQIDVFGNEVTCLVRDGGCDGTGLDISTSRMVARTDAGGIKTDRDIKMESGDEDLHDFGLDEFTKVKNTYIPYLRKGVHAPIYFKPNVMLSTGRMSYGTSDSDDSGEPIQQFSRQSGRWLMRDEVLVRDDRGRPVYIPGVRECIVARPGRYLCSTDYSSGELCTLAQYTKWIVGRSRMLEVINETRDPGSLHTMLGAQMLGISFEDMKSRVKSGDKQAKEFRQAAKSANFGFPGGLGAATLVLTNRRKAAGKTTLPDGRKIAGIRFCVLLNGAKTCGAKKITEWKKHQYAPICKECVEVAENVLKNKFFQTYPEVRKYLDWVTAYTKANGNTIPQYNWDPAQGKIVTIRVRGDVGFCDAANQGFQGLLADIFKRAYCTLTRESYLGVKDDGTPSVLYGSKFPLGLHDEPLGEVWISSSHEAAMRIEEVMKMEARALAPDPWWEAKAALMVHWSKDAEPVIVDGKLSPWFPKGPK